MLHFCNQTPIYDEDAPKRYVVYKPHKYAAPRYYLLKGSIYGQRSASREWYDTLAGWLDANGYKKQEGKKVLNSFCRLKPEIIISKIAETLRIPKPR